MTESRSRNLAPLTTMAFAAVLAAVVELPSWAMMLILLVAVVIFAAGWPTLLGLPTQRGSTTILALSGTMSVLVVWLTIGIPDDLVAAPQVLSKSAHQPLRWLAPVIALSVVVAFAHQLMRRDFRPRLVESVTGVVTGVVLVSVTGGWLASHVTTDGHGLIHTATAALVVAAALTMLPFARRITSPLAALAGTAVGSAVGALYEQLPWGPSVATSAMIGLLVVAFDRLFITLPTARSRAAALAHGAGVVCAVGAATYLTSGLLPTGLLK